MHVFLCNVDFDIEYFGSRDSVGCPGVLGGAHTHEKRTEILGIICVMLNTLMYGSPLSIMVRNFLFLLAKYSSIYFVIYNPTNLSFRTENSSVFIGINIILNFFFLC